MNIIKIRVELRGCAALHYVWPSRGTGLRRLGACVCGLVRSLTDNRTKESLSIRVELF